MYNIPLKNRLTTRFVISLTLLLLFILGIGLGFNWKHQRTAILKQEENRAEFMMKGLLSSLQTLMLSGDGFLARNWLDRVSMQPGLMEVQVIRRDGTEAFRDLKTIDKINAFLGESRFEREALSSLKVTDIPPQAFEHALKGHSVSLSGSMKDRLTYLLPIEKQPACNDCHEYDPSPIRGVFRVTTSLAFANDRIATARNESIALGLLSIILIGFSVFVLVRKQVIKPMLDMVDVTRRVVDGDMDARAKVDHNDELGMLALSLNKMTDYIQKSKISRTFVDEFTKPMIDSLIAVTREGTIQTVNQAICNLLGYQKEELIGQPVASFIAKGSPLILDKKQLDIILEEGSINDEKIFYLSKDGRTIPVLFSASVMHDKEGKINGLNVWHKASPMTNSGESSAIYEA